nr:unnamed protein product [Naegleria fowleri]
MFPSSLSNSSSTQSKDHRHHDDYQQQHHHHHHQLQTNDSNRQSGGFSKIVRDCVLNNFTNEDSNAMVDETPPLHSTSQQAFEHTTTQPHPLFQRPVNLSIFTDPWKVDEEVDSTTTFKTDSTITKQLLGNRLVYSIGENGIENVIVNDMTVNNDHQDDTSNVLKLKKKEISVFDLDLTSMQDVGKGAFGSVSIVRTITPPFSFYAIKRIPFKLSDEKNIWREFHAIYSSQSDFLVKLYECFFRDNFFNLVMEFMNVGNFSKLIELMNTQKFFLIKTIAEKPSLFPPNSSITNADYPTTAEVFKNVDVLKSICGRIIKNPAKYVQRFAAGNILTEMECSIMIRKVLEGLRYLRKKHIIHRDILVNSRGEVKITDFGLANIKTTSGGGISFMSDYYTICGTTVYLSPERLLEQPYSYDCDLWSSAVVLVELFTGKKPSVTFPFKWNSFSDFEKFVTCHITELRKHSASQVMLDFVSSCLKVDRKQRPTYDDILRHPFITGYALTLTEEQQNDFVLQTLSEYILPFINSSRQ